MMRRRGHYYSYASWVFALLIALIAALLISCGTNIPRIPITLALTEENIETASNQTGEVPTANHVFDNPTGTMEPTLAYWATAQENKFNSIYTQIAETKVAINGLATRFPQLCGFDTEGVFVSPTGEWIANDCRYFTDEFRVFQTDSSALWIIQLSDLFENYPNDAGSVDAFHWSIDGNFLYFTNLACCPDVDTLRTGDTLFILNLQTGDWESLIEGHFNYYSFSPDDQYLTYIVNNQANANKSIDLQVWKQSTGEKTSIRIGEFEQAGYAVWKQNGSQLALTAQTGNMYDDNRKHSLVIIDLLRGTSNIIMLNSPDPPYVIAWSHNDILTIRVNKTTEQGDYYIGYYDTLYYDLKTNQFLN